MLDGFQEILFTLRHNKLRTALTAFGVFWGILMLITLLGVGRGMEKAAIAGRFNDMEDSMWIDSDLTSIPYRGFAPGRQIRFTEDDMLAIRKELPDARYISSENPLGTFTNSDVQIVVGNKSGSFGVLGVADQYFNIKEKVNFNAGRRLDIFDKQEGRKVAVIGTRVVEHFFSSQEQAIGNSIEINGVAFKVVGVFFDKGNRGRMSERVYIPVSTFKRTFGGGREVSLITVRPQIGADGILLEEKIVKLLKDRHSIAPEDNRAIYVTNFSRITGQTKQTFFGIKIFIWLVGFGTLLAGVVGVSNIMIITVRERTREIGIRKALGESPNSIVKNLLLESVLVTSVAGYSGLVAGVLLLELASKIITDFHLDYPYFQTPEVNLGIALGALLLLIISGVIAGLIPALTAARIAPVEAMRAE